VSAGVRQAGAPSRYIPFRSGKQRGRWERQRVLVTAHSPDLTKASIYPMLDSLRWRDMNYPGRITALDLAGNLANLP